MEELIRDRLHEALDAEQPPPGLRARVIAAVPMERRVTARWRTPSLQWAGGLAAILITVAIVAGLVYARNGFVTGPVKTPTVSSPRLTSPGGLAIGPDGSLYVSDFVGNRVYRVQPDGSLVTVAGGGSLSEGQATKSNLFGPTGLAFDVAGNLYISDSMGGTVRRVDHTGNLTTLLSIHGAGQNLNAPVGLAFDRAGALYIADFDGAVLELQPDGTSRRLDLGAVPRPALNPGYVAFDEGGSLYIADRNPVSAGIGATIIANGGGCRIIRVRSDQSVSVIAGTGTCGFSGDGGPAVSAQLDDPNGIAFDSAGNLYFADSNNHRIRRIDTHGIITTVAGTGTFGHTGDGGPAASAELGYLADIVIVQGKLLYLTDTCGCMDGTAYGAIRMIQLSSGAITTVSSSQSKVVR